MASREAEKIAGDYFEQTRRPIYSILVSAPFFVAYQLGLAFLLRHQPPQERVRNGAEWILAWAGGLIGPHAAFALPVLAGMLLLYYLHRRERAEASAKPGGGGGRRGAEAPLRPEYLPFMYLEALVLVLPLVLLVYKLPQWLSVCGAPAGSLLFRLTTMCGAGAYEELLFRLFLFTGFAWLGRRLMQLEKLPAGVLAAFVSALLFALFHPQGNPRSAQFSLVFFVFATLAGLYFAGLCHFRSFGLAVTVHAFYDILCVLAGK